MTPLLPLCCTVGSRFLAADAVIDWQIQTHPFHTVLLFSGPKPGKLCNIHSTLFCSFLSPVVFNQLDVHDFVYFKNPLINYEALDWREIKSFRQSHKVKFEVCDFGAFAVYLHDYVLNCIWHYWFSFSTSHHSSLTSVCFLFLFSFFHSSRCLSNFEHFRRCHECCIASLSTWLVYSSLCIPLCRGGSLEKDKAVSSSIVSSVQSKITQVLFFAFIPNLSSTELCNLPNASAECSVFKSCKQDGWKVLFFLTQTKI